MEKIALFVLLFVMFGCTKVTGQVERGNRLRITSTVSITNGENAGFLLYKYTIMNDDNSEQTLETLRLDVDGVSKESRTLTNLTGPREKKWYFDVNDRQGLLSGTAASRILDLPPENGLAPGESMTMSFEAKGLPSISLFWATGWTKPLSERERDSLLALGFTEEEISPSDWRDNAYRGLTVGPLMPPEPFLPLAFLDTLISYKHQAFALGWIKNQGIIQSLDAKLENAKRQLQRNNRTAAKNILQAFINELEAFWKQEGPPYGGTQITSEAYALLKFNAEYLISKL